MKVFKRKSAIIILGLSLIFVVGYLLAKPHINRLLDNRERAVMYRHGLLIKEQIQALAHKSDSYPSPNEVKALIEESGLTSPHTSKGYVFIGQTLHTEQVEDSQIAYGLGEYKGNASDKTKAYFCQGWELPRSNEVGAFCEDLSLDKITDAKIKYGLSCETNWLGFSTGCDSTILQSP